MRGGGKATSPICEILQNLLGGSDENKVREPAYIFTLSFLSPIRFWSISQDGATGIFLIWSII